MGFRYELPPEKQGKQGKQMKMSEDGEGFVYIEEEDVDENDEESAKMIQMSMDDFDTSAHEKESQEEVDESEKDKRESRVVGLNEGTKVWVKMESGYFEGFLLDAINAIHLKDVKGYPSWFRFYQNVEDLERVDEVDVYFNGKSVTMKTRDRDRFRALKSDQRARKKIKE